MFLLFVYLFLALFVSFTCSVMEAVLLTTTQSYLHSLDQKGVLSARQMLNLKSNIDRPLSAILSLNTVAHTIGAAGVGAQATFLWGEAWFGVVSGVLTLVILVFSEIIPKSIGANYWRELTPLAGRVITGMVWVAYPLVILSDLFTRLVSRPKQTSTVSREEISAMTHLGRKEGVFDENESKIIDNLMRLKSIRVRSIMTPRTVVLAAPEEQSLKDFFGRKEFFRFSRIPVYRGNIDNITGYILKYDLLEKIANDQFSLTLADIRRPIVVCHESFAITRLFEKLISTREHIALVVDEYGGMEGLATMEDIIETILGLEIIDESDKQTDLQALAREKWKERAEKLNIRLFDEIPPERDTATDQ
ncbi:MAG: hemolysin family protein [Bacteroidales bacterium]|nr:hemolysin family protein [Bacteroidales bacterium]MDD3665625.1 hemolysin family protein [Bacteroidales bacterium]